jgi:hypothetical protein
MACNNAVLSQFEIKRVWRVNPTCTDLVINAVHTDVRRAAAPCRRDRIASCSHQF